VDLQLTLLDKLEHRFSPKDEETLRRSRNYIPSGVTALRFALVPPLVFLVSSDLYFLGAALFLLLIATDFFDGFFARRYGWASKFGMYFDVTADFFFVVSLFAAFIPKGFCADWILAVIIVVFVEFLLTGLFLNETYDPVGKYFGSLLYALIGLRFILSGQFFYDVVTVSVAVSAAASVLSRAVFILKKQTPDWIHL
jgi:phosphatidylglycerophosphate synthase